MSSVLVVSRGGADLDVLQLIGFNHTIVAAGDDALRRLDTHDAIVVDARIDLAWARTTLSLIRSAGCEAPVLLVATAQALALIGGDWGFTDFVIDGCEPSEFAARVRLLVRTPQRERVLTAGPIRIDEDAYLATVGGEPLDLTFTEFELLRYLVLHKGKVLTRDVLLTHVWGYDYLGGTRTVDVHIRRLRAKLGQYDHFVGTVRNVGYRLAARWEDNDDR